MNKLLSLVLFSGLALVPTLQAQLNHAPTFNRGTNQIVAENSGAQSIANWATNINANDPGQTLTFIITNNSNAALFSVQPVISSAGTLTYTPAANTSGRATITVVLQDNGAGTFGGTPNSAPQSFFILVNPAATSSFVGDPQVVWSNRYHASIDQVYAMVADGGGNVFVTGTTSNLTSGVDYLTIKYDASGAPLWTNQFAGSSLGGDDIPRALVVDAYGNVIVTGSSASVVNGLDYATIKYDGSSGSPLWTNIYVGPATAGADQPTAIGVDASGNVFVTGVSAALANSDYATLKLDAATGTNVWTARYNGPGNGNDQAYALVVDASGNVFVTGSSPGSTSGDDFATVKYNGANGGQLWVQRYNGPGNSTDTGRAIALDASGNIYVTGSSRGSGSGDDYATFKYNGATGSPTWTNRFNCTANGNDTPRAIVVDGAGNVIVTGSSTNTTTGNDFTTIKYDGGTGSGIWTNQFDAATLDDQANALAVDRANDVYVTGVSTGSDGTGPDFVTLKYSAAGSTVWSHRLSGPGSASDTPVAIAVDQFRNVLVSGTSDGGGANGLDYLTVRYVQNIGPVATGQSVTTLEDVAKPITLNASDVNGDTLAYFIDTQPTNGILSAGTSANRTYTPTANTNGPDSFTFHVNDGYSNSATVTVSITITPVNDAPSFKAGGDQTVLEDAGPTTNAGWATLISKGPPNESDQGLTFVVVNNSNPGLFSVGPAIDGTTGNLTYTPAANANGQATITLQLHDDGGTADGGVDNSVQTNFIIAVTAVNDVPSFTKGGDQTVNEDAPAQTVTGWATAISKGPPDESGQALNFIVSNINNALFSVQPAISSSGTLTYTVAANANGNTTVTVSLHDDGGVVNGGADTSAAQTFTITVNSVNDAPTLAIKGNQTTAEDSGAQTVTGWVTAKSPGPGNESTQTLTVFVSNNNNSLFSVQPAIDLTSGNLTYTSATNANGVATVTVQLKDDGGTANGGVDSYTTNFTITITAVNDAPVLTDVVPAQTGFEDVPLLVTGLSVADLDLAETNPNNQLLLRLTVTNGNLTLGTTNGLTFTTTTVNFPPPPVTTTNGPNGSTNVEVTGTLAAINNALTNLTYLRLLTNDFGGDSLRVFISDQGNSGSGGALTDTNFVAITVLSVNDAPSFTKGLNETVNEDVGARTVTGWATTISKGPANESSQTLNFIVSNDNSNLFSVQPAIAANGTLTYTPAANSNGVATVTVQLHDDGGTANGGVDTSAPQTFTITVNSVNDAPSFTKGDDQTVLEDAGPQTSNGWATAISKGPPNESGQNINFLVSNNNNTLFSVQPAISASGDLTYTPAANANGSALVTVQVHDDGGTANGGVDTSAAQTFNINVTAVNDVPSFTKGGNQTVNEDAPAQSVTGWATAISKGPANESSQALNFIVSNDNNSLFSVQPAIAANGTLTYTPGANSNGLATVTVQLHDDGGIANGGVDTSAPQTFTITVNTVNDAPSFTKGSDQTVTEDSGSQTNVNWATGMKAGPPNEFDQVLTFNVSNNNPGLFSVQPSVNVTNGTLTYTPAANSNGVATVTVQLKDDGGTANGGVDSVANNFTVTVTAVNDAPVVTSAVPTQGLLEDQALLVAGLTVADVDLAEAGANTQLLMKLSATNGILTLNMTNGLTFTTTTVTNFPLPNTTTNNGSNGTMYLEFTGTLKSINDAFTNLTYQPPANFNGSDTLKVVADDQGNTGSGGVLKGTNTVVITTTNVNDAPSFTKGGTASGNQIVLEDAGPQTSNNWAVAISKGPPDESGQTLNFIVSNNNSNLFSGQPAISPTGVLTYTPAADSNGVATVTVQVHDDGGTANGGADTSASQTFTITVTPVNDVPSFTKGGDQVVLEDAGPQTSNGWATAISAGPPNESGQTLTFMVSNDNNPLFSTQPAISPSGTLTYTVKPNSNGMATVTVQLQDNGGTANGGVDTSAAQTFTITVTPVNDAPSFTKGGNQTVLEDAGPQTTNGWATGISKGPPDESGQTLTFVILDNSNPTLFSTNPAIDSVNGNLTYTPATNASGVATITVQLQDNGDSLNGGTNGSAAQTFTITVTPVNDAPSFDLAWAGLTVMENAGSQTTNNWATNMIAGPPNESAQVLNFVLTNDKTYLFSAQPTINPAGTLTFTPAANTNGTAIVTAQLKDDGGNANGGTNGSGLKMFTIAITAVNGQPDVGPDFLDACRDVSMRIPASVLLANDSDPNGDPLTIISVSAPPGSHGIVSLSGDQKYVTYTPDLGYLGTDTFTYTVSDGVLSAVAEVTMNVVAPFIGEPMAVWTNRYNGPNNAIDTVNAMVVDGAGNVYVTGASDGGVTTGNDYATVKYNFAGVPMWTNRYNGPGMGDDQAVALALDANTNVVVTGFSAGTSSGSDYATIKINGTDGSLIWSNRFNGPGNGTDKAAALAVDKAGDVYVTGSAVFTIGGTNDFATIKINGTTGAILWANQYNGPGNANDQAVAIVVDAATNVIVTGVSAGSGTGPDYATIKIANTNAAGTNHLWEARYSNNGVANSPDIPTALALDGEGNVFVTGSSLGLDLDYLTVKYDALTGAQLWEARYLGLGSGVDQARAIAVDRAGNAFVAGNSAGDYATIKYDIDGNPVWSDASRYNGPANGADQANVLILDKACDVYVAGSSAGTGSGTDYAVLKYDGVTGAEVWTSAARYNGPGNGADSAVALAVDQIGNVFVAGTSAGAAGSQDYATLRFFQNLPPIITPIADQTTAEDTAVGLITFTVGDSFTPAGDLTVSGSSSDSVLLPRTAYAFGGSDSNRTVTITPGTNRFGTATVHISVSDGLATVSNSFQLTVTPVNDAPVVVNDSYTNAEDTLLIVAAPGVLSNDTDVELDPLTAVLVATTTNGTLTLNSNGSFTYLPNTNFNGTDAFTYKANDGALDSSNATVLLTITPVNDAPVLAVIADRSVDEGSLMTFTNSATDVENDTLTYSLRTGAPAGASIGSSSGVFTWTPTEAQGPGTNVIGVIVTDNGSPNKSATNTFTAIVYEVNTAPVLAAQSNRTNNELTTITVTNTATDSDLPANTLTFSLGGSPPTGATINATNGVFTWTPTEAQGPSTNVISVTVTDNGSPNLSDTKSFTVFVNEVNSAPTLPVIANQTNNELATLIITNTASDSDIPINNLTYLFLVAPSGATIDTNGVITWTPTEAQGPSTNTFTTKVTDDGVPALSATNTFTVVVIEVNSAPVLPLQTNRTIAELTTLTVTNTATDGDVPTNTLTYTFLVAPSGASIDSSGVITWTPTEAQGPSTNSITTKVTDDGTPALSATNTFIVIVNEVNSAPVLAAQSNRTNNELTTITVTNTATDSDLPANTLTFSLGGSPPTGATINATNGVFTWTPTEAQGPSTNVISVTVTDNGSPNLSDTKSFTVFVNEVNSAPTLPVIANQTNNELATLIITNTASDSDIPINNLTYLFLVAPSGATIDTNGVITWTPTEAQGPSTNTFTTKVTDDGVPALSATNTFTVIVNEVNSAPVLAAITNRTVNVGASINFTATATDSDVPANNLMFSLVSPPAGASITPVSGAFSWRPPAILADTTNVVTVKVTDDGSPLLSDTKSFTVIVNPLSPVVLTALSATNGQFVMSVTGDVGPDYNIQISTNLFNWGALQTVTPTSMPFTFTNSVSSSNRFYRVLLGP